MNRFFSIKWLNIVSNDKLMMLNDQHITHHIYLRSLINVILAINYIVVKKYFNL